MNLSHHVLSVMCACVCGVHVGCAAAPARAAASNVIARVSGTATANYDNIYAALRACQNGDTVIIGPGTYRVQSPGPEWLVAFKSDVRIAGVGMPVIEVQEDSPDYQIGIQMPNNQRIVMEGICLRVMARASSNKLLYGMVFTGCSDVLVSNCIFQGELYCSNSIFKNFVAVNGATNVMVVDSAIITLDLSDCGNKGYCAATHDAHPPLFRNVLVSAAGPGEFSIGRVRAESCRAAGKFSVGGCTFEAATKDEIRARMVPGTACLLK